MMEEKILEIILSETIFLQGHSESCAKEITAHVFEFIEWLAYYSQADIDLIGYWDAETQTNEKVFCKHGSRSVIHDAMSLKEVYEYWITNVKDK